MVAISPPAKVLITGANSYLATWVLKKYLEAGYSVRGTVRSLYKSAFLVDKFANYGDRFELVVVEDITKDGAFDQAVMGVDAIAHTASPFHYKSNKADDLIIPAVRGTTSILNSALKHGSNVKRVVLTSSFVAVFELTTVPHVFNESNWNDASVEAVKTKGSEDINTSQREIYDTLTGARTGAQLQRQGTWVNVAVVAEAHVRATHAVAAGGQRIVTSGPFFYQDFPELGIQNVSRGEPGSTKGLPFVINLETKKAEELLGLTPATPLKDVVAESVEDFKARGHPGFTAQV